MIPQTTLYPDRDGWRIDPPPADDTPLALDALAAMPAAEPMELALPTRLALFEWFTLPSGDPGELKEMAALQLEKRLPYPLEETCFGITVVSSEREGEAVLSRVFAAACHRSRLNTLAAPLIQGGRYPERVSLQILRVGSALGEGTAIALWWEEVELVFAVFEKGYPLLVEVFETPEELAGQAARLLMGAAIAGVSQVESLRIDPALESEVIDWRALFGVREMQVLPQKMASDFPNLAPSQWREARERLARKGRLIYGAKVAGIAAIGVVAAGFGLMAWKRHQLRSMEAELMALRPQMEQLLVTQARWNALAPAMEPSRFTVELLHRLTEMLPSENVRITVFKQTPTSFEIEGEAPTAREAVEYAEKLKTAKVLQRFTLEAPPPTLLAGERAQFVIRGK